MFDFGIGEVGLCFLVALIVLGPEKLPPLARKLGRMTGNAKSYMRQLSAEIERETTMSQLREQMENAKRTIEAEAASAERGAQNLGAEAKIETAPPPVVPPTRGD